MSFIEAGTTETPTPAATSVMLVSIWSTSATTLGAKPALWHASMRSPYMPGAPGRRTRMNDSAARFAQQHVRDAALARPLGGRVVRRQRHEEPFVRDLVVRERALLRYRPADEGHVEAPRGDGLRDRGGVALLDLELHARMGLAIAADQLRREAVGDRGAGEPERERSRQALRGLRAALRAARHRREDRLRLVAEDGAAFGELHPARQPAKERIPSSRSRSRTCCESGGCWMPRSAAARVKLAWSATARK